MCVILFGATGMVGHSVLCAAKSDDSNSVLEAADIAIVGRA